MCGSQSDDDDKDNDEEGEAKQDKEEEDNDNKGSLRIKKTVKLGKKSKPLLVPPSPLQLGNSLIVIFIEHLRCRVYVKQLREVGNWVEWG